MADYWGPHASEVEAGLRDARTQIGQLGDLHERLAALIGEAASDDGRIRAECTVAAVPAKLEIDPRAMRLGSEMLAETISAVIREASADLRRKMHETMSQGFDGKGLREGLNEARSRASEAMAAFQRAASDANTQVEGLRRRLGEQGPARNRS
jgi:DNA-binding protein YbaB